MKNYFLLLGLLLSFTALSSNPETLISLEPFHSIELKGNYEVYISQGGSCQLEIEGEKESVNTWVENGVLHVEGSGKIWKGGDAVLHIQVEELRSLTSSGAIELNSKGLISCDELNLEFAGASEVNLELDAKRLRLDAAGATEVELRGNALYADFKTAGASEINAMSFRVRSLGIETAGASELEVYATDEMKVKARGASEIRYGGNPQHIIRDLKGATTLEAI